MAQNSKGKVSKHGGRYKLSDARTSDSTKLVQARITKVLPSGEAAKFTLRNSGLKPEQFSFLTADHRYALKKACERSGEGGPANELCARLEGVAARFVRKTKNKSSFAIGRLDRLFKIRRAAWALTENLEALDYNLTQQDARKKRKVARRCAKDAEQVGLASLNAEHETVEQVWKGSRRADKALRVLCRDVAFAWEVATLTQLTNLSTRERDTVWASGSSGTPHPLWIVLDAVGLELGSAAVRTLVWVALHEDPHNAMRDPHDLQTDRELYGSV